MANAQLLVLVRSTASLGAEQIEGPVEAAARAAGFVPGPWTFNQQSVSVVPDPSFAGGLAGIVRGGSWDGYTFTVGGTASDPRIPTSGVNMTFNAYRQNFLNGPGNFPGATASAISNALASLPTVRGAVVAFRSPTNRISWDRGIPAPIELVATAPSGSSAALFGFAAVALLAFAASRGSSAKLSGIGKLSTNREGLTFEEWRRAATARAGTPGIHAAWARGEDPSDWRAAAVASRTRLSRYL